MRKTKTHRQFVGAWGEQVAETYLTGRGWQILGKNLRTPYGEIDILARQDDQLVFVEVKTRTNVSFGLPEASINATKQTHMVHAAEAYLQASPDLGEVSWRIDVIAILGKPGDPLPPEIEYFENALS